MKVSYGQDSRDVRVKFTGSRNCRNRDDPGPERVRITWEKRVDSQPLIFRRIGKRKRQDKQLISQTRSESGPVASSVRSCHRSNELRSGELWQRPMSRLWHPRRAISASAAFGTAARRVNLFVQVPATVCDLDDEPLQTIYSNSRSPRAHNRPRLSWPHVQDGVHAQPLPPPPRRRHQRLSYRQPSTAAKLPLTLHLRVATLMKTRKTTLCLSQEQREGPPESLLPEAPENGPWRVNMRMSHSTRSLRRGAPSPGPPMSKCRRSRTRPKYASHYRWTCFAISYLLMVTQQPTVKSLPKARGKGKAKALTPSIDGEIVPETETELEYDENASVNESDDSGSEFEDDEDFSIEDMEDDDDDDDYGSKRPRKSFKSFTRALDYDSDGIEEVMMDAAIQESLQSASLAISVRNGALTLGAGSSAAGMRRLAAASTEDGDFIEVSSDEDVEPSALSSEDEAPPTKGKGMGKAKGKGKAQAKGKKVISAEEKKLKKKALEERTRLKQAERELSQKLGRKLTYVRMFPIRRTIRQFN